MWNRYIDEQKAGRIVGRNYKNGIQLGILDIHDFGFIDDLRSRGVLGQAAADTIVQLLLKLQDMLQKLNSSNPKEIDKVKQCLKGLYRIYERVESKVPLADNLLGKIGAFLLNFVPDENGIYHSQPETWQRKWGYNRLYDLVFDIGTYMRNAQVVFPIDDASRTEYALWLWKGDYWNLESGAEIGLYINAGIVSNGEKQFYAVDFELPMQLSLFNRRREGIETLFHWNPTVNQWWVTGFNLDAINPNPHIMSCIGKIDFSGKGASREVAEKSRAIFRGLKTNAPQSFLMFARQDDNFSEYTDEDYIVWIMWEN